VVINLFLTIILTITPLFSASWNLWTQIIIHILLYLCLLLLILKKEISIPFYKYTTIPLLIFVFFCFISIFTSANIYESRNGFLNIIDCIIIYFLAKNSDEKTILTSILISGSILSLYAIYQRIFISNYIPSLMVNPNIFAGYLVGIICLTFSLFFKNLNKQQFIKNIFYLLLFLLFITALFLTNSIAAWLSVIFGIYIFLYLNNIKISSKYRLIIITVSISLLIYKIIEKDSYNRVIWWLSAFKMIWKNPLSGVGLSAFGDAYQKYKISGLNSIYAHNYYLQIAAEIGIFGFFSLIYFFKKIFSEIKTNDTIPFFIAIGAMLFHGIFDYSLAIPANAILFWTFAGFTSKNEEKYIFKIKGNKRTIINWLTVFLISLGVYSSINIFLGSREMARGKYFLDEKNLDIAQEHIEKSLNFDKYNPQTYLYLSDIYQQLFKITKYQSYLYESEIELEKASKLQKYNSKVYFDTYLNNERKDLKTALYGLKKGL